MTDPQTPEAPDRAGDTREGSCPRCGPMTLKAFGTSRLYECTGCGLLVRRHDKHTAITRTVVTR